MYLSPNNYSLSRQNARPLRQSIQSRVSPPPPADLDHFPSLTPNDNNQNLYSNIAGPNRPSNSSHITPPPSSQMSDIVTTIINSLRPLLTPYIPKIVSFFTSVLTQLFQNGAK